MSEQAPPPPYEYPGYQGQSSAPPQEYPHPAGGYPNPGYGTGHPAYPPPQPYPEPSGYPAQEYPGYGDKERTPLVGPGPQTIIIPAQCIVWGRYPIQTVCGNCGSSILTEIEHVTGTFTWLIAAIILLIGGWLLCCIIPFFADSCKDVQHKCPNCHSLIHTWTRL